MARSLQWNGTKSVKPAVSVGGTATQILPANSGRCSALISNNGAATVFLGGDNTVSPANGIPLAAGNSIRDVSTSDAWWGVTGGTACDVRATEVT